VGAQPMRGGFGGCPPNGLYYHQRSSPNGCAAAASASGTQFTRARRGRRQQAELTMKRYHFGQQRLRSPEKRSRGRGGAAHARGAWGESPQIDILTRLRGAAQRDAQAAASASGTQFTRARRERRQQAELTMKRYHFGQQRLRSPFRSEAGSRGRSPCAGGLGGVPPD
jgi:hypothetical protein